MAKTAAPVMEYTSYSFRQKLLDSDGITTLNMYYGTDILGVRVNRVQDEHGEGLHNEVTLHTLAPLPIGETRPVQIQLILKGGMACGGFRYVCSHGGWRLYVID